MPTVSRSFSYELPKELFARMIAKRVSELTATSEEQKSKVMDEFISQLMSKYDITKKEAIDLLLKGFDFPDVVELEATPEWCAILTRKK